MNFKNTKDIIIRVVTNFLGVTAVGALVLLIAMMFFAESIIFSKEVLGLLIGVVILCIGIGGLTSAVLIFFYFCTKKIAKLEKFLADRDKIIANQRNQLRKAQVLTIHETSSDQTSEASPQNKSRDIFSEILPLSEEVSDEETLIDEIVSEEISDPEKSNSQESTHMEDV